MIYVVTSRKLVREGEFLKAIERLAQKRVDAIILREKDLTTEQLIELGKSVKKITDKYNVPLIINGNITAALKIGCSKVHLSFHMIKNLELPKGLSFGVSIHSIEEVVEAEKAGAKYIIAGNIYETDCKKGLFGRGTDFITEIKKCVKIPLIAIGGISICNAKRTMEAGADGLAVMSSAMKDYDGNFIVNLKKEVFDSK